MPDYEGLIIVGVLVLAALVTGVVLYRSFKADGGCSCGCHSVHRQKQEECESCDKSD